MDFLITVSIHMCSALSCVKLYAVAYPEHVIVVLVPRPHTTSEGGV